MPVDPSAVKTWANLATAARVLTPMLVLIPDAGRHMGCASWFMLCSAIVDGYLARRHGATNLGVPPAR